MKISFLIVTKGRPEELQLTLSRLKELIDESKHEVLVFIDGCEATETLIPIFNWVNWSHSKVSISASPGRNLLYKKAAGKILIGLDDDAHPISLDFISSVEKEFDKNPQLGIIAFQEVKGIYNTDSEALQQVNHITSFLTNDFIGCGFAILKRVYQETNGFPVWIDIYGEEPCLAMEVLDLGYDIFYAHDLVVNHRVDRDKRKLQGKNYFRFERQLRNSFRLYVVYYPNPIKIIGTLLIHNFKKYALSDTVYFKLYWKAVGNMITTFFVVFKFRKPVQNATLVRMRRLKNVPY